MSEIKLQNENIKEFLELLLHYSQNERLVDNNRCLLAKDLYFDVLSLYNYILFNYSKKDNIFNNVITFSSFKKFIQENLDIKIHDEFLSKFFDFYSLKKNINDERYMEYAQFIDIFYPRYNCQLRRFMQQRIGLNNYIKSINKITRLLLQKLFVGEINKIKNIIFSLKKFNYINSNDIFKLISNHKKLITKQDLINFISKFHKEISFTEGDLNIIILSLSLNQNFNSDKNNFFEGITEEVFTNIFNIKKINSMISISFKDNLFKEKKDKNSIFASIIRTSIEQEKKIEEAKCQ